MATAPNKKVQVMEEPDIFKDDYIGRKEFCENLVNLIKNTNKERAWSIGLNGSWGSGKTVTLNYLEKLLKNEKVFFIKYNAWENDFYKDPLIAMLSTIIDYIEENKTFGQKINTALDRANETLKKTVFDLCKVAGGKIIDVTLDMNPVTKALKETGKKILDNKGKVEAENKKSKTPTNEFVSYKNLIEKVQEQIMEIAKHKKLVFVVDELDRCLPEYAIEVLERYTIFLDLKIKKLKI